MSKEPRFSAGDTVAILRRRNGVSEAAFAVVDSVTQHGTVLVREYGVRTPFRKSRLTRTYFSPDGAGLISAANAARAVQERNAERCCASA